MNVQVIALITGIGSVIVPPVVSLLKQSSWPAQVKQLIALVLSLAVSACAIAIVQPADFGLPFVTLGGLIYAGSQGFYALFKGSAIESALASVGNKTPPAA